MAKAHNENGAIRKDRPASFAAIVCWRRQRFSPALLA